MKIDYENGIAIPALNQIVCIWMLNQLAINYDETTVKENGNLQR